MDFVIFPSRSLCPRMEIECPACLPACVVGAKYTMCPRNKQYVYAFVLDGTEKAPGDRLPDAGQRVSPTQCRLPDAPCLPLPWRPTGRAERVGVDREEQRGPSWRIGCPRHMAPDHMPARPCRLEERSRCVRAHVPHFVPPLQFGKLRRCAYSPRHARLSRAHLPSARYSVIGLSDRLHHLLARGPASRPARSVARRHGPRRLLPCSPAPCPARPAQRVPRPWPPPVAQHEHRQVALAFHGGGLAEHRRRRARRLWPPRPVSPAALACKDLFSPICTSIGLIRPDFRPIGALFDRCGTLAQGRRGGLEGSDKAADKGEIDGFRLVAMAPCRRVSRRSRGAKVHDVRSPAICAQHVLSCNRIARKP